ncbi:MAG: hypothetical protein WAK23_21580, partial [Terriglobales bacterium]
MKAVQVHAEGFLKIQKEVQHVITTEAQVVPQLNFKTYRGRVHSCGFGNHCSDILTNSHRYGMIPVVNRWDEFFMAESATTTNENGVR